MKQPLLAVALFYLGGILLGDQLAPPWWLLLSLTFTLTAIALIYAKLRSHLLLPILFFTGWTNMVCHTAILSPNDLRRVVTTPPELVTVQGTLLASPTERIFERNHRELWRSSLSLKIEGLNRSGEWIPAHGKIVATAPGVLGTNIFSGQQVRVTGVMRAMSGPQAEELFNPREFYRRKGIYFQLQTSGDKDWQVLSHRSPPVADRFFAWAKKTLAIGLPEDDALRLTWTLMLDWKAPMTQEMEEPFIKAGTYHIFAVDGLRIGMIATIGLIFFRICRLPREYCGLIVVPLLWAYAGLTGWPASAVRAAVMMTIVIGGWSLHRPANLLNSLCAAAFILLLWDPQQLFQAGFQMSFFVVVCIALLLPLLEGWWKKIFLEPDPYLPTVLKPRRSPWIEKFIHYASQLFILSLAAWLGSIPLCAYYFHLFTPVSTPANLPVVPMTFLSVICGMGSLFFGAWLPFVSEVLNNTSWFLMKGIIALSRWFAAWSPGYSYTSSPTLAFIGLYYLLLLSGLTGWIFRVKFKIAIWSAILILTLVWIGQNIHERHLAKVCVLPLRGSAAVFAASHKNDPAWLMDCGDAESVARITRPFLHGQGLDHLDNFCLTIGHQQHIAGAETIINDFKPRYIYTSSAQGRSTAWRKIIGELQTSKRWETVSSGESAGKWQVLHPEAAEDFTRADDKALVLRQEIEGVSLLLLSDLGSLGQKALAERHLDLHADIVLAGLPITDEPLSEALLDLIQPKLIIVTDAEFPFNRRASDKLKTRLARRNIPVIYCHESGAVTLVLEKGQWEARDAGGVTLLQK